MCGCQAKVYRLGTEKNDEKHATTRKRHNGKNGNGSVRFGVKEKNTRHEFPTTKYRVKFSGKTVNGGKFVHGEIS
jgi:hypothetical protein